MTAIAAADTNITADFPNTARIASAVTPDIVTSILLSIFLSYPERSLRCRIGTVLIILGVGIQPHMQPGNTQAGRAQPQVSIAEGFAHCPARIMPELLDLRS